MAQALGWTLPRSDLPAAPGALRHPQAGDFWYKKLEAELVRLNFTIVEGWPSVFILYPDGVATVSFVVYVGDLAMEGTEFLVDIIAEIRKNIEMDEPADFQKYVLRLRPSRHSEDGGG